MRKKQTSQEALLWELIRNRRLNGLKFTRQHSIDNYIVDFYCGEKKLVIELEGAQHLTVDGKRADLDRDTYLRSLGYVVLRFPNNLVDRNAEEVLQAIITQAGQ